MKYYQDNKDKSTPLRRQLYTKIYHGISQKIYEIFAR